MKPRRTPSYWSGVALLTAALSPGCSSSAPTASSGGQTGEFTPPPQCKTGNSARAYVVKPHERVPELELSLDDALSASLANLVLDELVYEPYSGPGWVPDQVAAVRCDVGRLRTTVARDAGVLAVVYQNPSESCPHGFYLDATMHAEDGSGAIDETLVGSLALELDSFGQRAPSYWHFFAEQPLSAMKGSARPSAASIDEAMKDWNAAGNNPEDFTQGFTLEVAGHAAAATARLRFKIPAGTLAYADWRDECP